MCVAQKPYNIPLPAARSIVRVWLMNLFPLSGYSRKETARRSSQGKVGKGVAIVGKPFPIRRGRDSIPPPVHATTLDTLLIDHGFERSVQSFDGSFTASGHC